MFCPKTSEKVDGHFTFWLLNIITILQMEDVLIGYNIAYQYIFDC